MNSIEDLIRSRGEKAWTVQQVIDALSAIDDKTLPVWADGCDCSNPVAEVSIESGTVTLGVAL